MKTDSAVAQMRDALAAYRKASDVMDVMAEALRAGLDELEEIKRAFEQDKK